MQSQHPQCNNMIAPSPQKMQCNRVRKMPRFWGSRNTEMMLVSVTNSQGPGQALKKKGDCLRAKEVGWSVITSQVTKIAMPEVDAVPDYWSCAQV